MDKNAMNNNKEELYRSIYTHDVIYVPPHEETSAPLEISLGCSWHQCTFCDFAKDAFQVHPIEKIEHNAAEPFQDSMQWKQPIS